MSDRRTSVPVVALLIVIALVAVIATAVWGLSLQYGCGVAQACIRYDGVSGNIQSVDQGPFQFRSKGFFDKIIDIDTNVQTIYMHGTDAGSGLNQISAITRDSVEVQVEITMRYAVSPDQNKVVALWRQFPQQTWQNDVIIPHIRSTVRDDIPHYDVSIVQDKRPQIADEISTILTAKIANDTTLKGAIQVDGVDVRLIQLPQSFLNATAAKVAAQQDLQAANFTAQAQIVRAQGAANATIVTARGLAQAQIIAAGATATAQITIANGTETSIHNIAVQLHLNANQTAALTQSYVFMQQLSSMCAMQNNPCTNLFLLIGNPNSGQFFLIPTKP